jgi:RHH-type rel operon transcriptional repressor/antitoxin RelB
MRGNEVDVVCPASIAYRKATEVAMLTVKLPTELEQRLDAVARKVGRSKHDLALGAIVEEIQDLEDGFLALERLNSGEAEFYTLEEVRERLGLTD